MDVNNGWSFAAPPGPVKVLLYQRRADSVYQTRGVLPTRSLSLPPTLLLTKHLSILSLGLWFHKCTPSLQLICVHI